MIAGILALCVVIAIVSAVYSKGSFERTYAQYFAAETAYEDAAFKPGAEENPVRQQVNYLLGQVLQAEMTPQERIAVAEQGIMHLNDIEEQIDDIKTKGDAVAPLLEDLDASARSFGNLSRKSDLTALVNLGKRQAEIISDIRGLSYRADYYSTEIFERIIDDQGVVTDDHKRFLNDQIPQLEEQYDKRTNLYMELKQNSEAMSRSAAAAGLLNK